jgi:hypothetical protein
MIWLKLRKKNNYKKGSGGCFWGRQWSGGSGWGGVGKSETRRSFWCKNGAQWMKIERDMKVWLKKCKMWKMVVAVADVFWGGSGAVAVVGWQWLGWGWKERIETVRMVSISRSEDENWPRYDLIKIEKKNNYKNGSGGCFWGRQWGSGSGWWGVGKSETRRSFWCKNGAQWMKIERDMKVWLKKCKMWKMVVAVADVFGGGSGTVAVVGWQWLGGRWKERIETVRMVSISRSEDENWPRYDLIKIEKKK